MRKRDDGVVVFTASNDRQVFDLRSFCLGSDTGTAYDFTQTDDELKSGDLFVCEHEGRIVYGVLLEAWPVAFDGLDEERQCGELHTTADGTLWEVPDLDAAAVYDAAEEHATALMSR